jgi:hypothetical protein
VVVRAGFGTVTRPGEPPRAPVPLLPAPDLAALPTTFDRVPLRLPIRPVPGAVGYRLTIATTAAMEAPIVEMVLPAAAARGPDLADGAYRLRLRAIDPSGLEGLEAEAEITVNARPEPPVLIKPLQEGKVRDAQPTFAWAASAVAAAYRLQLAADQALSSVVFDASRETGTQLVPPVELSPGTYYWRMATIDAAGEEGPFGDLQSFTLRPALAPGIEAPEASADDLTLRWRAGLPGQRHQIQMAKEPDFQDIILDQTLAENQVTIPRPDPGTYHLRIRTIDDDGYVGPYGPVQSFALDPLDLWPLMLGPFIFLAPLISP